MTWSWVKTCQRCIDQRARLPERLVCITPLCTALFTKTYDSNDSRNITCKSWLPPIVTHVWRARRKCCVCTRNWSSTSSSSLTRRFSLSLHLSTFRTIAFTCHSRQSRQRSAMLPLTDYSVYIQRSASCWQCRLPCPSSGARTWFSSRPGLRSMATITKMSCWQNTCCQQHNRSLEITIFQQDSAPVHRACDTVDFLRRSTAQFITPDMSMWPPNSTDLNAVDYKIWGVLQDRVYKTATRDLHDLKRRLIAEWSGLQQSIVDDAVDQWRKRLRYCVETSGRHFEHLL